MHFWYVGKASYYQPKRSFHNCRDWSYFLKQHIIQHVIYEWDQLQNKSACVPAFGYVCIKSHLRFNFFPLSVSLFAMMDRDSNQSWHTFSKMCSRISMWVTNTKKKSTLSSYKIVCLPFPMRVSKSPLEMSLFPLPFLCKIAFLGQMGLMKQTTYKSLLTHCYVSFVQQ